MFVDADDELNGQNALAYFYKAENFDSEAQMLMLDFVIESKDKQGQSSSILTTVISRITAKVLFGQNGFDVILLIAFLSNFLINLGA